MCGILGSINKDFDYAQLGLLRHRGPDHCDLVRFNLSGSSIVLGHTRLSIIDPSGAGHQPMQSHDGNYIIIYNGEIYNHLELRQKIGDEGFAGHSDTETAVNYIAEFGIEAVRDFNGIFALAVFDKKREMLYLARDPFGVKPLYYYQQNGHFIFSSELKPILSLVGCLEINREALAVLLKLKYTPSPLTLLQGIKKLRPGHILEINLKNLRHEERCFIRVTEINRKLSDREAAQRYLYELETAVKRQLLSDVELGVLLSGGLDSALVAYFAQKNYGETLKTFSIGFGVKDDSDELREAKMTAGFIGSAHSEIIMTRTDFESIFEKVVGIVEEPLCATSQLPMYYLTNEVAKHMKVVLSGQGADELWGGYARYQGEFLRSFIPASIVRFLLIFFKNAPNEKLRRGVNALWEKDDLERFIKIYTLFSDSAISRLLNFNPGTGGASECLRHFYDLFSVSDRRPLDIMLNMDARTDLSDHLLLYTDKISMHHSLEVRVPFLDIKLMNFVESLPFRQKVGLFKSKIIHKKAAEQVLPSRIVSRRKKGFSSPTREWFSGAMGMKYEEMLTSDGVFCEYFSRSEVHKLFKLHREKKFNYEKELFLLISLFCWLANFYKNTIKRDKNI